MANLSATRMGDTVSVGFEDRLSFAIWYDNEAGMDYGGARSATLKPVTDHREST